MWSRPLVQKDQSGKKPANIHCKGTRVLQPKVLSFRFLFVSLRRSRLDLARLVGRAGACWPAGRRALKDGKKQEGGGPQERPQPTTGR